MRKRGKRISKIHWNKKAEYVGYEEKGNKSKVMTISIISIIFFIILVLGALAYIYFYDNINTEKPKINENC